MSFVIGFFIRLYKAAACYKITYCINSIVLASNVSRAGRVIPVFGYKQLANQNTVIGSAVVVARPLVTVLFMSVSMSVISYL